MLLEVVVIYGLMVVGGRSEICRRSYDRVNYIVSAEAWRV